MSEVHYPQAFLKSIQAHLGNRWKDFANALQQPPPISIRYNPYKTNDKKGPLLPVPWAQHGAYLAERPSFTLDPIFHAGSYYVQEASSMFLEQAFTQVSDPNKPLNILDLCAAPGGKSTHLLSLMNQESLLVSNEVIQSRASVLAENIQKWGHSNVVVTNNDPKDFQRLPGFFDVIVIDAPCSGEGLFRKDPDAIKEWSEDHVALCSRRQRRILSDVWPSLKTGGILIYSTCTYNEAENEKNLNWLAQEYDVETIPLKIKDEWSIIEVEQDSIIGYRFFHDLVQGEGFFISVLKKKNDQPENRLKSKNSFGEPSQKIKSQLSEWILQPELKTFINRNDRFQFFPKNKTQEIEFVVKNLHIITAGTYIATSKHDKLIPEHAMALSIELNTANLNLIPLGKEAALQYLRKETIPVSSDKKGFALITFQNIPLGWVNVLENRMNNLYPSEWRIRMKS
jgi:16S rRNA C967 or C1407 C5-methylase (RsmB/RsmF family)/NOL1/NOP2/fmu family ribosome biogenesis protein